MVKKMKKINNLVEQEKFWKKRKFFVPNHKNTQFRINIFNKFKNKGKTLDIGCGYNHICKDLGVDIAIPEKHFGKVMKMDFNKLSFPDNSFDNVVSWCSNNHTYTFNKSLFEMVRVCKPKGKIIFECPNKFTLIRFTSYLGQYLFGYDRIIKFGQSGTLRSIPKKFNKLGCNLIYSKKFSKNGQLLFIFEKKEIKKHLNS